MHSLMALDVWVSFPSLSVAEDVEPFGATDEEETEAVGAKEEEPTEVEEDVFVGAAVAEDLAEDEVVTAAGDDGRDAVLATLGDEGRDVVLDAAGRDAVTAAAFPLVLLAMKIKENYLKKKKHFNSKK